MKIYFDESGTTGPNLADPATTVFTLASTNISDTVANDYVDRHFANFKKTELKYSDLKRDNAGKEAIEKFIEEISTKPESFNYYLLYKPFAVFAELQRYFVRPWLNQNNSKLGQTFDDVFISNIIYSELCTNGAAEPDFYKALELFVAMMKRKDDSAYDRFWDHLEKLIKSRNSKFATILQQCRRNGKHYYTHYFSQDKRPLLSTHISMLMAVVCFWETRYSDQQFEIIHDESSELKTNKKVWDDYCSKPDNPIEGYSFDIRFPLPVQKTEFSASSKTNLQLQLCDVLAGYAADFWRSYFEDPTKYTSLPQPILMLNSGGIYPDLLGAFLKLQG